MMKGSEVMTLNDTPSANRIHIGIFGKRNSGKSSLLNAFVGQDISIVSNEPGTTTDPVYKPMEIHGLGPCVLIDTAGFDDVGSLGESRVNKSRLAIDKSDIALMVVDNEDIEPELEWYRLLKEANTPVVAVISKADERSEDETGALTAIVKKAMSVSPIIISSKSHLGIDELKEAMLRALPEEVTAISITGGLVSEGDSVLLVMPQDIQAPKGRLILPQVQTLRELLDKKCLVMSCTTDKLDEALSTLKKSPKLIVTDSQVFDIVYEKKPADSMLTSFSVLFAAYKGDIDYYVKSAESIATLNEQSHVLIAECCTHAPLSEDIGREKIPCMLRKKYGESMDIQIVSGTDFPKDLSGYDLIIQCGACMFNRKYVMSRIDSAKDQGVPMTNYGITIAYLKGILDKIEL